MATTANTEYGLQVHDRKREAVTIGLLLLTVTWLFIGLERDQPVAIAGFTALTGLLLWLAAKSSAVRSFVLLGLGIRIALLFTVPSLSDDFWRFLWDGELWLAGYHPLDFIPTEAPTAFAKTNPELLDNMNSPGYYTVYPPLSQVLYALAAALGKTWGQGLFWLKLLLLLAELAVFRLLFLLDERPQPSALVLYAIAPLAFVELIGNVHFEGFALSGLLLALYGFRQNKPWLSGLGLGIGVAVKLVPAIAGPAFLVAWLRKRSASQNEHDRWNFAAAARFVAAAALTTLACFVPFFLSADLTGFGESLDLYFRSFEFNGSLYTFAAWLGELYKGWNWISVVGPSLALVSLFGILGVSIYRGLKGLPLVETLLWCFAIYLACATTVHPWYAIYVLGLGVLTPYRWPLLLSITVLLSYIAYSTPSIAVPNWVLLLEYLPVLGLMLWEVKKTQRKEATTQLPSLS